MTRLVTAVLAGTFVLSTAVFAEAPAPAAGSHAASISNRPRPVREALKKLFVKPLPYPAPRHGANEGMNPAEIQARRAPARATIDKPFFDPETISVDETMTDFQVETYLAEKVMIRLIQKEGGKPGSRDRGLSAFGYYDPKICADTRADSAKRAQGIPISPGGGIGNYPGHVGWQGRAGRAEGLQVNSPWMSAENEALSSASVTAPPPARKSFKSFEEYTKAMEAYLEKHARGCVTSWYQSAGHYAAQVKYAHRFCYSMGRNQKTNMYMCTGLFTNADFPDQRWKADLLASDLYQPAAGREIAVSDKK